MQKCLEAYLPRLRALPGEISLYAESLKTGESIAFQPDIPLVAASVIKLPILVEAFRQAEEGMLSMKEEIRIRPRDKMPSCGVLTYLHDGITVRLSDLCVLMMIVSDNTAANLLMDRLGMEQVNQTMRRLGLEKTTLRRRLFDSEAAARGLQNEITAREMALLLKKIQAGACVSPQADARMLQILKDQRLNGKIPFYLHGCAIAHKTGEDDGVTHDVGIVFAENPFILCLASNHTCVPDFERLMQDIARDLAGA